MTRRAELTEHVRGQLLRLPVTHAEADTVLAAIMELVDEYADVYAHGVDFNSDQIVLTNSFPVPQPVLPFWRRVVHSLSRRV